MAITHGKDGVVKVGANTVGKIKSWTLTFNRNFYRQGYAGDEYFSGVEGIKDGTGSVVVDTDLTDTNGQVAMASAVTGNTQVQLKLYFSASSYWDFPASLEITDAMDTGSAIQRTFNFVSEGTITYV